MCWKADGRQDTVFKHARRFLAAVSSADRLAIATPDAILVLAPGESAPAQIATAASAETIVGVAWSPDGTRIASTWLVGDRPDAVVQVMSAKGEEIREVWRGQTATPDTLLAWLDDERLAHSFEDPRTHATTLETIQIASRETKTHEVFRGTYVGAGGAARGVVVVLRGVASHEVQLGDKSADKLVPMHDRSVGADSLAGWTTDGELVFAAGATPETLQVVRASPGTAPVPWTNTDPGLELPDTVIGNDVIVHYVEHGKLVIDRIDPIGTHTELLVLPGSALVGTPVRCAGDRAAPCVLQEIVGRVIRWSELDLKEGTRGRVLYERPLDEKRMRDAARSADGATLAIDSALSADGSLLAIVDGTSVVTVIDVATGVAEKPRAVDDGTAMQSVAFAPDGELWGTSIGYRGRAFGLMSFKRYPDPAPHYGPARDRGAFRDAMRQYWRPAPSADASRVAVAVRELHLDVWRIDGM